MTVRQSFSRARALQFLHSVSIIRMLAAAGALVVLGCESAAGPDTPGPKQTLDLAADSISLTAGANRSVAVAVSPSSESLHLMIERLPPGVRASANPDILAPGQTASVVNVLAEADALPGHWTVTVRAVAMGSGATAVTRATADLHVRVSAPSSCPGYAIPTNCPPFPTGGSMFVTGFVRERTPYGLRPYVGGMVYGWVQRDDHGYATEGAPTDTSGAFRLGNLPHDATILLQTGSVAYDVPCATVLVLDPLGPLATVDLEVVHVANPIVEANPSPPALVGVVYEMTPNGRVPVPGVRLFFETFFEIVAATTTTDSQGRYSMCRLPSTTSWVTPVKSGYITAGREITVNGVVTLDLELRRQ